MLLFYIGAKVAKKRRINDGDGEEDVATSKLITFLENNHNQGKNKDVRTFCTTAKGWGHPSLSGASASVAVDSDLIPIRVKPVT